MSKTLALMEIAERIGMLDEAETTFSGCVDELKKGKHLKPETLESFDRLTSKEAVMRRIIQALDKVLEDGEADRVLRMTEDPAFSKMLHCFTGIMKAVTMETMHEVAKSLVEKEDMEDIMDFLYDRIKERST